jgi:ribosomal protein S6--L-glutamate ligase
MILSFHPCVEGDRNRICAGRLPGNRERAAIQAADAVILPQGCSRALYEMAREHCAHVFPNYDARFRYPGKSEQIRLFRETGLSHPKSGLFGCIADLQSLSDRFPQPAGFDYPFVFKFPWGGEGEAVFPIRSEAESKEIFNRAARFEKTGQKGFLIQEYVPTHRSLRIVRIGETFHCYWRVMDRPDAFGSSLARGAHLIAEVEPAFQSAAVDALEPFCNQTGINLAGFDVLFSDEAEKKTPLFIEINYFFGRRGLGGSENFYRLLNREILRWLDSHGLGLSKIQNP